MSLRLRMVLLLPLVAGVSDCARILALVPLNAYSHFMVMQPWLEELAKRGHQVTVFSPFPQASPLPNYTDVHIGRNMTRLTLPLETIRQKLGNPFDTIHFANEAYSSFCDLIGEPPFQNLLKNDDHYNVVVTELFGSDCMTYLAYKLKIPLISYTTTVAYPWFSEKFGFSDNPSYIPNVILNLTPEMTLLERAYNAFMNIWSKYYFLYKFPQENLRRAEEAFGEPLPPLHEVVANTSLLLVNSYHALFQSRPFPPNVIEVGGIHIRERKPLPEDLKKILDEATNGVLVVSFGSMVQTETLPYATINVLLKVFSQITQTVIFKYEGELPLVPKNVIVMKWLPQRDIIEHENVVAVFGHGGLASTIEAVYFNKPLLGMPFYGDQYNNIKFITRRNAGLELDHYELTESKVANAVRDITTNPKYKEGMRRLSQQFRDRPMTALQSAVYWTEYVIRHQGAPHLRPASVSLPLHQYLLLDVIALLIAAAAAVIIVIHYLLKHILVKLWSTKNLKTKVH